MHAQTNQRLRTLEAEAVFLFFQKVCLQCVGYWLTVVDITNEIKVVLRAVFEALLASLYLSDNVFLVGDQIRQFVGPFVRVDVLGLLKRMY